MIKAKHTKLWLLISKYQTKILIGFFFDSIKYNGDYEEKGLPILMIANHFSFYDGFIQIILNFKIFKRRFHFMMLERELRKNMQLAKLGAFSINKGKRSSLDSLAYSVEILENNENLFLFFPQGKIESVHTRNFTFEKGVLSYILKKAKNEFQLVFNINLIHYGTNLRPDLFVYYETFHTNENTTADDVEKAFNSFAKTCFTKQGAN